MTITLLWSCVAALRLEPIGPIQADVFGLQHVETEFTEWWSRNEDGGLDKGSYETAARYHVAEPRRLMQFREALGGLVDSPTGLRRPEKTPFYTALCEVHRSLTEEGM